MDNTITQDGRITLQPSDNGPTLVRGPVKLMDPEGNEIAVQGSNIALCRCGHSGNKPFCDGTHSKVGFKSKIRADAEGRPTDLALEPSQL